MLVYDHRNNSTMLSEYACIRGCICVNAEEIFYVRG